jgi:O-antigen ligase
MLLALLLWTPLPLGSNRPILWAANGLLAGAMTLALLLAGRRPQEQVDGPSRSVAMVMLGFLSIALWIAFQALMSVPLWLEHPLWRMSPEPGSSGAISIDPAATWAALAQFCCAIAAGLVAYNLALDEKRAQRILRVALFSTLLVAVYGLLAYHNGWTEILWVSRRSYGDFLTGTFVNRNNAATFFAFGLMIALSLFVTRMQAVGFRRTSASELLVELTSYAGLYLCAAAILLVAVLNTGSRAGAAATAVGAVVIVAVSVLRRRRKFHWMTAVVVFLVLGGLLLVGSDALLDRFLTDGLDLGDRKALYAAALRMIETRPFLGNGAGTFADMLPIVRGAELTPDNIWLRAHSTYLDVAAGIGIPAFIIGLVLTAYLVGYVGLTLLRTGQPAPAGLAMIGAAAVGAAHSFLDFSLQIQAIAFLLAVLLGTGFGEACRMAMCARALRRNGWSRDEPGAPDQRDADDFETIPLAISTGRKAVGPRR